MKHYLNSAVFFILLIVVLISHWYVGTSLWLVWIPILIFLIVEIYGAFSIGFNFHLKSISSFNSDSNRILLTFDDGPHAEVTPLILDILKHNQAKAVFFMIGSNATQNKELVKRILDEGHEVGNHSWSHSYFFGFFGFKRMREDLQQFNQWMLDNFNYKIVFFRPPFGVTTPVMRRVLASLRLISIGWTFRSFDTSRISSEAIVKRFEKRISGGQIVLLHDNVKRTPEILEQILNGIRKRKFKTSLLSEFLSYGQN